MAAIHTDTEGLEAGNVQIGDMPGYRARPAAKDGPFPVVLVVQEIFGINEYMKDVCRRLAKLGYYAVAPELYYRQGDPSKLSDHKEIFAQIVTKVPDAQVMSDLDAAAEDAVRSGKGDASRLAITGFCWGGRAVWLYAAHRPDLKAGVAWYGRLAGDADALHPKHPVDVAANLKCPVLGLYGALDQSIPLETVERMRSVIRQEQKNAEIVVYPEAGHAFHADYRQNYMESAAREGWRRMKEWFAEYV
jgi:carboxymethylenebutenolidase